MTDFIFDLRKTVLSDWQDFQSLVKTELKNRSGTVDKARYQAVRGMLKEAVAENPVRVFENIRPLMASKESLKNLNGKLFFVLFEQFMESIIHRPDNHFTTPYGDRKPKASLISELNATLSKEVAVRGNHGGILFWKGITSHLDGNKAAAEWYLLKSAKYDEHEFHLAHYLCGARTVRKNHNSGGIFRSSLPIDIPLEYKVRNSSGDEELVIFSCADEKYYSALSGIFLDSINALGRKICVHLHIAAHDAARIDVSALDKYQNIKVDVSHSRIGDIKDRSWFTVLRWLLMPSMLKEYGKLVITSDFDVQYLPDNFDAYVENLQSYDIGININPFPRNRFPWTTINANQLACSPTPTARLFASELRNMTLDFFDPERADQWWIDQNILYSCYHDLRRSRLPLKIYNNFETPVKITIENKKQIVAQANAQKTD